MIPRTAAVIPVAPRIGGFVYAIRNIVAEARKVEAAGRKVRYLNIGDPITFGFKTPPHMIEAVERAMRDGHNGYAPSVGILAAREAVAAECVQRGMPMSPDRVVITSGTSEGIELALTALAGPGDEVLIPVPTYPLYTAVLAKIGARAVFYRTDPARGWQPDLDHVRSLIYAGDARARGHRSRTIRRARSYSDEARRALRRPGRSPQLPAARRRGLRRPRVRRPGRRARRAESRRRRSSRSRRCPRRTSRRAGAWAGWRSRRTERLDEVLAGIKKLADGRLCSNGPMEHAIVAALTGDRSHQQAFRDALRERAAITHARLNAIDGISLRRADRRVLRDAEGALPPGMTDEDYVLALLRATGVLCVYGSGFGTAPRGRTSSASSSSRRRRSCRTSTTSIGEFTREFLAGTGR